MSELVQRAARRSCCSSGEGGRREQGRRRFGLLPFRRWASGEISPAPMLLAACEGSSTAGARPSGSCTAPDHFLKFPLPCGGSAPDAASETPRHAKVVRKSAAQSLRSKKAGNQVTKGFGPEGPKSLSSQGVSPSSNSWSRDVAIIGVLIGLLMMGVQGASRPPTGATGKGTTFGRSAWVT